MVTITTAAKSVTITTPDFTWNIVKLRIKGQTPIPFGTRLVTEMGEFAMRFDEVTGNGSTFTSAEDLQGWIVANCFSLGGGGVMAVIGGAGITVDDSDPANPVVSATASSPTWDDVSEKPEFIAAGTTTAQARSAIGLGSASTYAAGDFATAVQGDKADSAVQPAAISAMVQSKKESGVGTVITNYIALTQAEYDGLAVKNPSTAYDIIS